MKGRLLNSMKRIITFILVSFILLGCTAKENIDNSNQSKQDLKEILDFDEKLGIGINENNFPDQFFRSFILNNYDVNKNSYLSKDEIDVVNEFPGNYKSDENLINIVNLEGINYFTNIIKIGDYDSELLANVEKIDISRLHNLQEIALFTCRIKDLDLSNNKNINKLCISNTYIDYLKLCSEAEYVYVSISDVPKGKTLYFDISKCSYFSDYKNILNDLHLQDTNKEEFGTIQIVKDGKTIIKTHKDMVKGAPVLDENSNLVSIKNISVLYLGQGDLKIENNSLFDNAIDAFNYGLNSNSWFCIETYMSFEDDGCYICGYPGCLENCKSNIKSCVKIIE